MTQLRPSPCNNGRGFFFAALSIWRIPFDWMGDQRGAFRSSGNLAMPAATFLASSLVMSFAAARRPGSLSK
jgi:hypothetical protein